MPLKVLDCTLRDGGYYNNWDFSQKLVKTYLSSIGEAGIDAIEIGFRMPPQNDFRGAFAYSSDDFLRKLPVPGKAVLAVMVNASDIITHHLGVRAALDKMFAPSERSPVGLVRIAVHLKDIAECRPVAEGIKGLGYRVALNMMQVGGKSPDAIASYAREVWSWGVVDVLYFADSLGNMDTNTVKETIEAIKTEWSGYIGIHAHNNMGRAVANTFSAVESGATWLDGTVLGMGRGAGNAETERLLIELSQMGTDRYQADALFPLVLNEFEQLHQKYKWGSKLLYYLSGAYNIHPSYVQEILRDNSYSVDHIISALQSLRGAGSDLYSLEQLQESMQPRDISYTGTWSAAGWAKDRPVLVVAAGPWVREHMESIIDFIERVNPVVICLNTNLGLPREKVTAYAACHAFRFAMEAEQYLDIGVPLIAPAAALPKQVVKTLSDDCILNYGMTVKSDHFSVDETGCVIPKRMVAAYVFAFANAAGASRILLAGFDGYSHANPLQQEMEHVFQCYQAMDNAVPITAVTPTTYSVSQSSIFAPDE